ncbi:tetratricopeptide repeat protein [Diaphorobacter ruginosibacter]|uniref:Tetratricopeptide repeat protein n=1 Tax=Diaphorobacter ruginosibacter TaxID=1715720 RepID=A0A7G9RS61_9BURK|nr:tetratricopeptide repeat protein [Diaphorobacter ruginosibacter]QNN58436.1 tetratricopeptide repeat protein [Diaphorobacter ruginosibacter]
MALQFNVPTPLEYFACLVQEGNRHETIPLLEAAVCISQDAYPQLDVQEVLDEVDQLQLRLKRSIPPGAEPMRRLNALNQFFFSELGFSGNLNNYYDPDNSYLNAVLRTRRGIPISLAVLWLELAQSVNLRVHGISFPGHFLVKAQLPEGQVVIDPTTGRSLSREELSERIDTFVPNSVDDVDGSAHELSDYLRAASPRQILVRMLRNLKEIHRAEGDWQRMIDVECRLIALLPQAWNEWRDRGFAHVERGHMQEAIRDLETYLAHEGSSIDADAIQELLLRLRESQS